jgi:Carboxypeptidase regulatory-like domain
MTARILPLLAASIFWPLFGLATADEKNVEPEKKGPTGTVEGKVTYKGKPLAGAYVTFHPEKGKKVFSGKLDEDGTYTAKDVPVGKARVTVEVKAEKGKAKGKAPRVVIPAKYADPKTSGLTADVKKGKQIFDIDLR